MSFERLEKICKSAFKSRVINTKSRKREDVDARKAFAVIAYYNELGDVEEIMKYVNRDRTTFNHYQKEVLSLLEIDKVFKRKFEFCRTIYETVDLTAEESFHLKMINYHNEQLKKIRGCKSE